MEVQIYSLYICIITITTQHTMQATITTTNRALWSLELAAKAKSAQTDDERFEAQLRQAVANGRGTTIRFSSNPSMGACTVIA